MSNADLIERLRHRKTANACSDLKEEAANALEEADRKERDCEAQHGDLVRCNAELHRHLAEVEHNLEIAVAA